MQDIYNVCDEAKCIIIHSDGKIYEFHKGAADFENLLATWNEMIEGAHSMPAFGVSLNNLTIEELKGGLWIEFIFGTEKRINGMSFEKLLIAVNDSHQGFNLIRYTKKAGYDGRCYYLALIGKNMANLATEMRKLAV